MAALVHHCARAPFTTTALRGDTQLQLDIVKSHAGPHMADDFTVGDPVAHTDDHGSEGLRRQAVEEALSINTNPSHLKQKYCAPAAEQGLAVGL
jgi:hypothetical protein